MTQNFHALSNCFRYCIRNPLFAKKNIPHYDKTIRGIDKTAAAALIKRTKYEYYKLLKIRHRMIFFRKKTSIKTDHCAILNHVYVNTLIIRLSYVLLIKGYLSYIHLFYVQKRNTREQSLHRYTTHHKINVTFAQTSLEKYYFPYLVCNQ